MSNSWYAIPNYNAALSCVFLQFSSNDLSIVTTIIPPNSGSEKEKKIEQYAFLIKKEKSLNEWSGSYFWLREIICERICLRKFRYDFSRFISRGNLFQINGPLYFIDCFATFILQNLG